MSQTVSSFFSSIADKAQTAIQSSPLGSHGQQSNSNGAPSTSGRAITAINHQLRSLKQQYGSASPVQKIITSAKGVSIAFDNVSRGTKASSKELYMWGQNEAEDIKDVTDRLGFFNFVSGSLADTLAQKLDEARAPMKALRNAEATLAVRLHVRAGYEREIAKIEADRPRGEKRLAELEQLLRKAEIEDNPLEKEVEVLLRKALRESEQAKWDAIREYGEKLILLSQASSLVIDQLPTIPPNAKERYAGAEKTATIRAGLQRALDNYKTGSLDLPISADISRSDTRSFGETHASELSSIRSLTPISQHYDDAPSTETVQHAGDTKSHASKPASAASPVIDPLQLNQAPAPLPAPTLNISSADPAGPATMPTVAETGVPQSAGPEGPGPSSGSLKDIRSSLVSSDDGNSMYSSQATAAPHSKVYESAEDEKKRLEREERERILRGDNSASHTNPFESEEDKKLEREKSYTSRGGIRENDDGEELPQYDEF